MNENELAKIVFDCGLKVHRALGPGLLESAYEKCLYFELWELGIKIEAQKTLPLKYNNFTIDSGYRVDLLLDEKLIIEIKAVESLSNLHKAQVLTYLKMSGCKLGLLINFNTLLFKDGIKRIINGTLDSLE